MKTKNMPVSLYELHKEISEQYIEWLEMGYPMGDIALSLLRREKERNVDLQMKIDRLERMLNS